MGAPQDPAWSTPPVARSRRDLALALRAAEHHGFSEGICNHFSLALPDQSGRLLINPRGLLWGEVGAADIVLVDEAGQKLAGRHEVEATAMFIHAAVHRIARKTCVLHTHMPYATALTVTRPGGLDTTLSQNAMRFHGRVAVDSKYNGAALDVAEGQRIARAMQGRDIAFLANHGVIVCGESVAWAYDDLYYLERACQIEVLAATSRYELAPTTPEIAAELAACAAADRLQSDLFFEALGRLLPEKTGP